MDQSERLTDLWGVVARIPFGCVASYGNVGQALERPVSGLLVGRWMFQTPASEDIPWWRVVGAKGDLLIGRRDASLALMQREKLEAEGVEFEASQVRPEFFIVP
jgi:methylated-DNA-protein-cysteine methyltransferase-like protein